jgi:Putative prokaryotic signal transducing protein
MRPARRAGPPDHAGGKARQLKELTRTNDMVRMSFLRALLTDAGMEFDVFDTNMNAVLLAPRLMVDSADYDRAKRLLREAGVDEG